MRKLISVVALAAATALVMTACSSSADDAKESKGPTGENKGIVTLKVGASPSPHAEILKYVKDNLAKDAGIDIDIEEFSDYVKPNQALADGTLDANYFQHVPFLETAIKEQGYKFSHFAPVHLEPLGIYSKKHKTLEDLPEGATIGITNDPSNQARALQLLADNDLITFNEKDNPDAPLLSVQNNEKNNPKKFSFQEVAPEQVVLSLPDVDLAVINSNFALSGHLSPSKDALKLEDAAHNPYANVVAYRTEDKDNKSLKTLDKLLHSSKVSEYIKKTWPDGEVLPSSGETKSAS